MQISAPGLLAIIATPFVVALCAAGADVAKPTDVEFWHVGDDALSQKLAEGVENEFKRSPDFILSSGRKPGTLVVTIPANVEWNMVGKRTKVMYTVKFSSTDNQEISERKGTCWENTLPQCASQIVKDAKVAARKIRR